MPIFDYPISTSTITIPCHGPCILGIPFDDNSSYLRGPAQAPVIIRKAFHSDSSNYWSENLIDLGARGVLADAGDLTFKSGDTPFDEIEDAVLRILEKRQQPISLGGDHSVTLPIVRAVGHCYPQLTIVHFDAHPDLYHDFQGNPDSHASPFARIMEEKLAARLIQIGIRTLNGHQKEQAKKFGVQQFLMASLPPLTELHFEGPVYISFDMDVLDPAFAPGVSHHEPGGLSIREALSYLNAIKGDIVGADIVELNPTRDPSGITAMAAAKILKELAGKMLAPR